jgi:hypothetical protein
MRTSIRRVVKLIRPHGIVQFFGVLSRLMVIVLRVLVCDSWNGIHLRAEHLQQLDLLPTLT